MGVRVPPFAHPVLEPPVMALRLIFPGSGGRLPGGWAGIVRGLPLTLMTSKVGQLNIVLVKRDLSFPLETHD